MNTETKAILAGIAILGLTIFFSLLFRKKILKTGKITNRTGRFYSETHIFTTRASFAAFYDAFRQFHVEQDRINVQDGGGRLQFTGPGFSARIVPDGEESGALNRFSFDFTGYRTRNGVPLGGISMNKLLTAVEKAFLTADLDATVTRIPKAMKTKTDFF